MELWKLGKQLSTEVSSFDCENRNWSLSNMLTMQGLFYFSSENQVEGNIFPSPPTNQNPFPQQIAKQTCPEGSLETKRKLVAMARTEDSTLTVYQFCDSTKKRYKGSQDTNLNERSLVSQLKRLFAKSQNCTVVGRGGLRFGHNAPFPLGWIRLRKWERSSEQDWFQTLLRWQIELFPVKYQKGCLDFSKLFSEERPMNSDKKLCYL